LRIVNASPLILLTKVGRIDLLNAEGVDVVVPMPVLQEVSSLDPNDPVVRAIDDAGWSVVDTEKRDGTRKSGLGKAGRILLNWAAPPTSERSSPGRGILISAHLSRATRGTIGRL